jgi:hypothetical protein
MAVQTLLDWYRAGADVQARLPLLSTWLGHANPAATFWYLHDMEIKERALARTTPPGTKPGRYSAPDSLLTFLDGL